jgi:cytochrome c oxidase subunit IV
MTPDSHSHAPATTKTGHADVDPLGLGEEHEHPTWSIYWKVATVLTLITVVEVYLYYLAPFVASAYFVPTLLILSAAKFTIVVLFYMHLKYDAHLFRALFGGPLILAMTILVALLLLFGKVAIRLATPS